MAKFKLHFNLYIPHKFGIDTSKHHVVLEQSPGFPFIEQLEKGIWLDGDFHLCEGILTGQYWIPPSQLLLLERIE